MGRLESLPLLFQRPECGLCSVFSHRQFPTEVLCGIHFILCLGSRTLRYRKFLQVQQNKFVLAEVALRFWCRYDNFWMWSVFAHLHQKIQLLGFGTSLNSIVATSTEHSVHLSIFQLPKRTHFSHSSIWYLFFVAKTSMEVNS